MATWFNFDILQKSSVFVLMIIIDCIQDIVATLKFHERLQKASAEYLLRLIEVGIIRNILSWFLLLRKCINVEDFIVEWWTGSLDYFLYHIPMYLITNWVIATLFERMIGWFSWLVDWLIGWLVDWLNGWLVDWLIGWLVDWLTDWLVDLLIGWLVDWL